MMAALVVPLSTTPLTLVMVPVPEFLTMTVPMKVLAPCMVSWPAVSELRVISDSVSAEFGVVSSMPLAKVAPCVTKLTSMVPPPVLMSQGLVERSSVAVETSRAMPPKNRRVPVVPFTLSRSSNKSVP